MQNEYLRRWRLILGGDNADGTNYQLDSASDIGIDGCLGALYEMEHCSGQFNYEPKDNSKVGRGKSQPQVARWLGDIRNYFPQSVVQVLQNDAMQQPNLQQKMLLDPDVLAQTQADVQLLATLLALGKLIPDQTKDTARQVVEKVVAELLQKIEQHTVQAISGAINRSVRNRRPRHNEIDWNTTIRKNLQHYQPEYKTIIPETRIGFGKKTRRSLKDIILCIDQSGSMGTSVVYSGIFGAVLASLPAVSTRMVAYDTAVTDLSENLKDPIDLLFGVQLGGGNDTNLALKYCQSLITRPDDTVLVLISDLYEGGGEPERQMRQRMTELVQAGVTFIVLLALHDDGTPSYERGNAQFLAQLGVAVFACTPDLFPDLMAAALTRQSLSEWAGKNNIVLKGTQGQ
jgi:hypothetical protein